MRKGQVSAIMRDLAGRWALLTGASSGLGPVIARHLQREGVRFVLSARRRPELEAVAAQLGGGRVVLADLTRSGEAERLAAEAGLEFASLALEEQDRWYRLAKGELEPHDR